MGTLLARLDRVDAGYGRARVLSSLSLELRQGEQLALLGPSGAGKSTVLALLTGDLPVDGGSVEYPQGRPRTGLASQDHLLFPWLTIEENVALGLRFAANAEVASAAVGELLAKLGLTAVGRSYPDEVSGGQAQRASLARAFAISPELVLLDEPLSALDPQTRGELQIWLRALLVDGALTSVIVTHDIDEALVLADRIVLLTGGGQVAATWLNPRPAADHHAALVHPLRAEIRRGYTLDLEADDAEFSGPAPDHIPTALGPDSQVNHD